MRHRRSLLIAFGVTAVLLAIWARGFAVPRPGAGGTLVAADRGFAAARAQDRSSPDDRPATAPLRLKKDFGQMPVYFVENRGQLDSRVAYAVQGRDTSIYFEKKGVTFALTEKKPEKPEKKTEKAGFRKASLPVDRNPGEAVKRWAVKLDFVGANPNVRITADQETSAVISYFKGPKETWKTGLPTYSSITYRDLWPGIDLVYSGTANRLKYGFVVKPGADPARVRLAYRGAAQVLLNDLGQLEVETPAGGFKDDTPYAYQEIDGRRSAVNAVYALEKASAGESRGYGFELGAYDRSKPLVLDPAVFVYAGYIGGGDGEVGNGIAVDSSGNVYVTGNPGSQFPVTVGPDLTSNGAADAFVAKVNASGTALLYAGYIGGSGGDIGNGIAVDSSGNAYVTGITNSTEATFPVTVGPDLTQNGVDDAFVAKVNAAGTALVYCGYIGGSGGDFGLGIAVDGSGNAYVTGLTGSTQATFPVTVGPDLTQNGGNDAFVAKVNASGTALVYCGYIGGSSDDWGRGVAVDSSGNAYVTGYTGSSQATFPVTVGPDLTYNGGFSDAFVAKVNAAGTALVYCGYIGGSGDDFGRGIAVNSLGNAYVAGDTSSTESTLPVTVGPDLTQNGDFDAFVAKVNAAGTALIYAGYIGGSGFDTGYGIAVDSSGNAYVTGWTNSTEATFPVAVGPDLTQNGGYDAFVAKVNAAGTALLYAGYIGGSGDDFGYGIAVDSSGNAYVTGSTSSTEATFPVTVGPDLTYNGGVNAFVAKISESVPPSIVGDFNGDKKADILLRNTSTGSNAVWLMNGTTVTSANLLAAVSDTAWRIVGTGDFNGDGSVDILWRRDSGDNAIWLMNGTTLVGIVTLPIGTDPLWKIVGTGDFNGDGKVDILWRRDSGENAVWLMNGSALGSVVFLPIVTDPLWKIVGTGDFSADGKADILWRRDTGENAVWTLNGTAILGVVFLPLVTDPAWKIVATGDYNGDGAVDIVWRRDTGENAVWLMNGTALGSVVSLPIMTDPNWKIVGPK